MVPPSFSRPELLVTITGVLEVAGAVGRLLPTTVRRQRWRLAAVMVAMFPANAHPARRDVTIRRRSHAPAFESRIAGALHWECRGCWMVIAEGTASAGTGASRLNFCNRPACRTVGPVGPNAARRAGCRWLDRHPFCATSARDSNQKFT